MTFEVPKDLVERVRILLKKEAGVDESYKPSDPSVNLPSIEEIIASFDPSPDDQRCEHCNGKLLRGVESMVCVYCGREQQKEQPQPISFTSTIGYRWLLDSLSLDGSEIVAPVKEGSQKNKKSSPLKNEVVLSDFLNLEMEWPVGSDRFGTNDTDEAEIEGKRPLHLVGVESDDPFSESKTENISSFPPGHPISIEQPQSKEHKTFRDKEDSSLSGWQAEFQPASPSAQPNNENSSLIPQRKDSLSLVPAFVQQSAVGTLPENVAKDSLEPFNPSSDTADLSHENHLQNRGMESVKSVNNIRTDSAGPDDFSDAWDDFTGSTGVQENQHQESGVEGPDEDSSDVWDNFMSSGAPSESRNASVSKMTSVSSGNYPSDAWNDFTNFGSAIQNQQENSGKGHMEHETVSHTDSLGLWSDFPISERQGDKSKNLVTQSLDDTTIKQDNNSFDLLDSLVGTAVPSVGEESSILKSASTHDAVDPWGDFMSLNNPSLELSGLALGDKDINNGSGPFDPWNDFDSSVMIHDNNKSTKEDIKNTSDSSLKSTGQMAGSIEQPGDSKSVFEDDSFNSWSDFRSSSTAAGTNLSIGNGLPITVERVADNDFSYGTSGDFGSSDLSPHRVATENKVTVNDDPFSSLGGFGASSAGIDQWQKSESKATQDDLFNGWSTSVTASGSPLGKVGDSNRNFKTSKSDNSFDVWSEFASSMNVQNNQLESPKGSTHVNGEAPQVQNVPFDSWDMLMSSSASSNSYQNGTSSKHSSDPSLFSSAFDSHDSGLRSSLGPDLLMKVASDAAARPSETPIPTRNDAKISREIGQNEAKKPSSMEASKEKPVDDVEQLISQMPDLSFMLADSLSVPKKAE